MAIFLTSYSSTAFSRARFPISKRYVLSESSAKRASAKDLQIAAQIFQGIGATVPVKEQWLDAVTAVSGSGPAYVFLFIECFTQAAESLGLSKKFATVLINQTLKGSLRLVEKQKEDPRNLRLRVTSKGGTTQAAIDIFFKYQIDKIFVKALESAEKRAKELAK